MLSECQVCAGSTHLPSYFWLLAPNRSVSLSFIQTDWRWHQTRTFCLLPFINLTPGHVSQAKSLECARVSLINLSCNSDRRKEMSDAVRTSHPWRKQEGGGYEKRKWDEEVLGGICSRTPRFLLVLASDVSREAKKRIQILGIILWMFSLKKPSGLTLAGNTDCTQCLPQVRARGSVREGKLKQVWLQPKETWCLQGWHVITS